MLFVWYCVNVEICGKKTVYITEGISLLLVWEAHWWKILWEGMSGWKLHFKPLSESWHPGEAEQLIPGNKGNNPLNSDFDFITRSYEVNWRSWEHQLLQFTGKHLYCSFHTSSVRMNGLNVTFFYDSSPRLSVLIIKNIKDGDAAHIRCADTLMASPFASLLSDCQCDLIQRGLVNSLVLALIYMGARVTIMGAARGDQWLIIYH